MGSSWADFADQLALSKLGSVRIEGCSLASKTEGASQQPDALVKHIDSLLDDVFQVCPTLSNAFHWCPSDSHAEQTGQHAHWRLHTAWLLDRGSLATARCLCEAL